MKAKEYLRQLVFLECRIVENIERVNCLKDLVENRTSNLSLDKVQSSKNKDKLGDAVCSYAVLEERIRRDEEKKQEILDTIGLLDMDERIVIYQCYVSGKFLREIATDLKRSYSWVAKKHVLGISKIQAVLDNRVKSC